MLLKFSNLLTISQFLKMSPMKTHFYTQLQLGSSEALAYWYDRYQQMLFYFGRRWLKDHFVVENLVQDCFIKLWQQRETLESPQHIFFFLRLVMKRGCISHFTQAQQQFNRSLHRLEQYEHYNDYLLQDDRSMHEEHLARHAAQQHAFEQVQQVLPLLSAERRQLIELCLRYGFRYLPIAQALGKGMTETANEVKRSITELQRLLQQDPSLDLEAAPEITTKPHELTPAQAKVFSLRCEEAYSFSRIAKALDCSPQEAQQEFMKAYLLLQHTHPTPSHKH